MKYFQFLKIFKLLKVLLFLVILFSRILWRREEPNPKGFEHLILKLRITYSEFPLFKQKMFKNK